MVNRLPSATREQQRRESFHKLASAFGETLDMLIKQGIEEVTDRLTAPVKQLLIEEVKKARKKGR